MTTAASQSGEKNEASSSSSFLENAPGLLNPYATSYLNSVIQCLYHIPAFREAVYKIKSSSSKKQEGEEEQEETAETPATGLQRLFYQVSNAISKSANSNSPKQHHDENEHDDDNEFFSSSSSSSSTPPQSTDALTKLLGWNSRRMKSQQDAGEFLVKLRQLLLEQEEEESSGSGSGSAAAAAELALLFSGLAERTISVSSTGSETRIREAFQEIFLPVHNFDGLGASLNDQVTRKDEVVPGQTDAEMSLRYLRFPPVLFVPLNRFEMSLQDLTCQKLDSAFNFPLVLSLGAKEDSSLNISQKDVDEMKETKNEVLRRAFEVAMKQQEKFPQAYNNNKEDNGDYELFAVLVHSGTAEQGHYSVNLRDFASTSSSSSSSTSASSQRWFNFDDDIVTEVSTESAVNKNFGQLVPLRSHHITPSKNAYMLTYVRKSLIPSLFFKANDEHHHHQQQEKEEKIKEILSETLRKQLEAPVEQAEKLRREFEQKDRSCNITLLTDEMIEKYMDENQNTEIFGETSTGAFAVEEMENNTPCQSSISFFENNNNNNNKLLNKVSVTKDCSLLALYEKVSSVVQLPMDQFLLHWYCPTVASSSLSPGNFNRSWRVGSTALTRSATETLSSNTPRCIQRTDNNTAGWNGIMYLERKVALSQNPITNAAKFASFEVSSGKQCLLDCVNDSTPALPFVDNRMFYFDQTDINAKFEVKLRQAHTVTGISFQSPLPKEHMPGATYACTRYEVKIDLYEGFKEKGTYFIIHKPNGHEQLVCDKVFDVPVAGVDRITFERQNVVLYDSYYPTQTFDQKLSDQWIVSRLKVHVPENEIPQQPRSTGGGALQKKKKRFVSESMRSFYLAVKFYSHRESRFSYVGHIALPIGDFVESNFPTLREMCGLKSDAKLRLCLEANTGSGLHATGNAYCALVDANRKHFVIKRVGDFVDSVLLVQEEPESNKIHLYKFPYVKEYLNFLGCRSHLLVFSYNSSSGSCCVGEIHVAETSNYESVASAVADLVNGNNNNNNNSNSTSVTSAASSSSSSSSNSRSLLKKEKIRLYGCRDAFVSEPSGRVFALPASTPLHSEKNGTLPKMRSALEAPLKSALADSKGLTKLAAQRPRGLYGFLFYEELDMLLTEEEKSVSISLDYCDELGTSLKRAPTLFETKVPADMDLTQLLTQDILPHFKTPFTHPHVLLDIVDNVIENFATFSHDPEVKVGYVAGILEEGSSIYSNTTALQKHKNAKTVDDFFRNSDSQLSSNRRFEIRPFPVFKDKHLVYAFMHGEYHPLPTPHSEYEFPALPPFFCEWHNDTTVQDVFDFVCKTFNMKKDVDFEQTPKNHHLMLQIQWPLHFNDNKAWATKIYDFFQFNPSKVSRPKSMLINWKHKVSKHSKVQDEWAWDAVVPLKMGKKEK